MSHVPLGICFCYLCSHCSRQSSRVFLNNEVRLWSKPLFNPFLVQNLQKPIKQHCIPRQVTDVQRGIEAGSSVTVSGSSSVTVPDLQCSDIRFLCVSVSKGVGASYVDSDPSNNVHCIDVTELRTCNPGLSRCVNS